MSIQGGGEVSSTDALVVGVSLAYDRKPVSIPKMYCKACSHPRAYIEETFEQAGLKKHRNFRCCQCFVVYDLPLEKYSTVRFPA